MKKILKKIKDFYKKFSSDRHLSRIVKYSLIIFFVIIAGAVGILLFEYGNEQGNIKNSFDAIWWALVTPLYIEQALTWGALGLTILFFVHWSTDLGWLTGLAWLTGSGRTLFSARVYRVVLIICGAALLFFGITFVIAGIGFLVTGEVSLG